MRNDKEFGSRIKQARQELGITIERAAEYCDVSESVWRQYEGGRRFPTLNRFVEVCLSMEQRPEYFLADELENLYDNINELISIVHGLKEKDIEILLAAAKEMRGHIQRKIDRDE